MEQRFLYLAHNPTLNDYYQFTGTAGSNGTSDLSQFHNKNHIKFICYEICNLKFVKYIFQ